MKQSGTLQNDGTINVAFDSAHPKNRNISEEDGQQQEHQRMVQQMNQKMPLQDDSESENPFVPPNVPDESNPDEKARFMKEINSRYGIPDYVPIWQDDCCDNRMFLLEGKKCQDACVSLCPDPSRRTAPICYSDCNAKFGRHASQFKDFRNSNKVV